MIDSFQKENEFLSNFYPSPIVYEGIEYPTVEHAFQAVKSLDENTRKMVARQETPGLAKREGRHLKLRSDWESVKVSIMHDLLLLKFSIPELKNKLLNTGNQFLVEGNYWHDTFWGVCNGEGENQLGHLLMEVRKEIR